MGFEAHSSGEKRKKPFLKFRPIKLLQMMQMHKLQAWGAARNEETKKIRAESPVH
jgi:hypothetical protein